MSQSAQPNNVNLTPQATAAAAAQSDPKAGSSAKNINSSTTVSNMAELKTKAPEVYKAVTEGIAMSMIGQMKDRNDRLIEKMKEERARNG